MLRVQDGVIATIPEVQFQYKIRIRGFTLFVVRKSGLCENSLVATGPVFTKEMHDLFETIQSGDELIIANIRAEVTTGETIDLAPVQYHIVR